MTTSTTKQDIKTSIKGLISLPFNILATTVKVVAVDVLPLATSAVNNAVPVTKELLGITATAFIASGVVLAADKEMDNAAVSKAVKDIKDKTVLEQLSSIKKSTPSFINESVGGEW